MKDRMTLGHGADVAETAALTLRDDSAAQRIFDSADWECLEREESRTVRNALRRLAASDRKFAHAVLKGATWRESGMTKQGFNKRLKKILDFLRSPVNIG